MRVKKHLALILILAVLFVSVFPTGTAYAASDYSYIKVKLSSMGSVTNVKFTVNGDYYIKENPYYTLVRGKTYTIKSSGSGVALVDGSLSTYLGTSATFVRCESSNSVNWLTLNNTKTGWTNYPGDMTFRRDGSYVTSICRLYMEMYLVGVVAHEMSPSWPAEALKAQAIAARTYAMRYIYPGNAYDVVDTTTNQVYKGYNPDRDGPVVAAISATKGMALFYGSSFADGVYSASNGGQIQPRAPRWGSSNLYHELKDDPYDMKNPASPRFEFYFPKTVTTSNSLEPKLRNMMLSAMSSKLGVSASAITIVGVNSVTPYELPPPTKYGAYPAGSRKFQKVSIVVNYSTGDVTIPTDPTVTAAPGQTWTGTIVLQSSSRLRIRSGPSTSNSISGYVPNGGKVTIYEQRSDGWYKIKYDNLQGYVYGSYVSVDSTSATAAPAPTPTATPQDIDKDAVISNGGQIAILRKNPEATSIVLYYIQDGASIHVISDNGNGWLKVRVSSIEGYILAESVSYDAPTVTPTSTEATESPTNEATATSTPAPTATPAPSQNYSQVTISLVFDDMQAEFASYSSYLKYHSILDTYVTSDGKSIVLRAGRFGHGIGLSQRGAQQMANEGKTYNDIINFYYNGTTLRNMNVSEDPLPVKTAIPTAVGVVLADSLNVRSGPGSSYSVLTSVNKGETVNVIVDDTWCKIYVPSKKVVGYVAREYLDITHPDPTPTPPSEFEVHEGIYKVAATRLNMREGPSTDFAVKTTLDNGELVTRYSASGEFFEVKDSLGNEGWCSSKYLTMVSAAVTPSPSPTPSATPTASPTGSVQEGKKIYLRQETDATSQSLSVLENQATFEIIEDRDDGWIEISYDSQTGYIEDDFAEFDGTKEDYYEAGTLTAQDSLYASADTQSDVISAVASGESVWIITDRDDGWVQAEYESEVGFILDDNLDFNGTKEDIEPTPTITVSPTETDATPTVTVSPTETDATPTVTVSPTETDATPTVTVSPTETDATPTATVSPTATPTPTTVPKGTLVQADKLYSEPETYSNVLAEIPSGAEVTILEDRNDGWIYAEYNSTKGYIIDDNVTFEGNKEDTDEYRGPWAKTTNGTQILYNEPSTISYVLMYIPSGTYVKLLEDRTDGFIKVNYDGVIGYMVDDDMEFEGTKESSGGTDDPPTGDNDDPSELVGTVTASTGFVRLRKSANLTSAILAYVPINTEVVILEDRSDGWVYVNYNDLLGYMVDDYVDFEGTKEDHAPAPSPTATPTPTPTQSGATPTPTPTSSGGVKTGTIELEYSTSRLRIRSSASTSSSILGHVPHGANVKVLDELSSGWLKIEYSGVTGYVSGKYVDVEQSSSQTTGEIVNCSYLSFRSGPDTSYSLYDTIKNGTTVTILDSSNGWYKINYNSKEGWVSGKYVSVGSGDSGGSSSSGGTTSSTGKITASSLRVRSGAGLNYSQIGSLLKGTTVTILGESNGFYKINYESQTGYISKTYVNLT